jgi:phage shock protein C
VEAELLGQGTDCDFETYLNCGGNMYCNYCGKSIQDDANVCAYCGTRVGGVIARKRLVRPREGRKVAGVCMGMAEYFDIDVTIVRVVWLITAFATGVGFIGYLIAWIVMPEEPYLLQAQVPAGGQQVTNP